MHGADSPPSEVLSSRAAISKNEWFYLSVKIMECIFINYNVQLVLTQALHGSPFEPHPHQNSNWSNGTEIDELLIVL